MSAGRAPPPRLAACLVAAALAACSSAEDSAREAVLRELQDPQSARFGAFTRTGDLACLSLNARFDGLRAERDALLAKAETRGERQPWRVIGLYPETHSACLARAARYRPGDEKTQSPEAGDGPAAPLLATADAARGAQVFRKCAACHSAGKDGPHGTGPNLWNVMGAPVAGRPDYRYSPMLRAAGGTWTPERMDAFLRSPRSFAPGTKMTFAGLRKAGERADLLAYLAGQADAAAP